MSLYERVVEDLWASFGYDSPETHAHFLIKMISKDLIEKFLADLRNSTYQWTTIIKGLIEKWEKKLK